MTRQTINPPIGMIPPPPSRARRNRAWEKQNPTVSYRLPLALRETIANLAADHQVTASELARFLLEHALSDLDAGRLRLDPQLAIGKFTLFPEKRHA